MIAKVYRTTARAQGLNSLCLCAAGLLGLAALAVPLPASAQSNDTLNRLKRLENEVDTLNRAVYRGEKPPASGAADAATASATANLEVRIGQLESDLRDLTGRIEQQGFENRQLQERLGALEEATRRRFETLETGRASASVAPPPSAAAATGAAAPGAAAPEGEVDTNTIDPGTLTPADQQLPDSLQPDSASGDDNVTGAETGLGASGDAASLYERGFAQIKQSDYPGAQVTFADFMKRYPDHALAPNALYWLGETYYARKDYAKASRTFAEAYQKYPNGPKGADNLLKLGLSLAAKGEKDNACIALTQLRKEYPKGPEAVLKRGEDEARTLGCK